MNHFGRTFPTLTSIPPSHLTSYISYTKVSSQISSTGVKSSLHRRNLMLESVLFPLPLASDTSKMASQFLVKFRDPNENTWPVSSLAVWLARFLERLYPPFVLFLSSCTWRSTKPMTTTPWRIWRRLFARGKIANISLLNWDYIQTLIFLNSTPFTIISNRSSSLGLPTITTRKCLNVSILILQRRGGVLRTRGMHFLKWSIGSVDARKSPCSITIWIKWIQ